MNSVGPPPSTGPRRVGQTTNTALRDRLRSLNSRTKYLEKNRFPAPLGLHELANAPSLQQAQPGHAAVFSPIPGQATGAFQPSPVLASMVFTMPGALTAAESPPFHARYICNIVGISADLATFASDVEFTLAINGTVIQTVTMTSASTGFIDVTGENALHAYTDLVTITTTSIGSGNEGLVVHVELAVDVNNPPS